jgi:SAM-dependent methyltransferase
MSNKSTELELNDRLGVQYSPGARHYRAFVGPPEDYDRVAAWVFTLLASLGMRETHKVLDVGCGSLRVGRLLIPYLLPDNYYGIEPEDWLIQEGIQYEVGQDQIDLKKPSFSRDANFNLSSFNTQFDYIIAQSIFSHASPNQIAQCMTEAVKVMHTNSIFITTFLKGDKSYQGNEGWVYPDIVAYRPDDIIAMVEKTGLVCKPVNWPHRIQNWLLIIRPENEQGIDRLERGLSIPPLFNDRFVPLVDNYKAEVESLRQELTEKSRQNQVLQGEHEKLQRWALEMQGQLTSISSNRLGLLKKLLKR